MSMSMMLPTAGKWEKEDSYKDEIRQSTPAQNDPLCESNQDHQDGPWNVTRLARTSSFSSGYTSQPTDILKASASFSRTSSAPPTTIKEPVEEPSAPLPKDPIEDEYDIVLDETLPMGLEFIFSTLWRDEKFTIDGLKKVGETNIEVTPWSDQSVTYTAFERPETFHTERKVSFTHNKKNLIGPSSIPTVQVHRYNYIKGRRLVVSVSSSIHDAPFADYFRAESRWVFDQSLTSTNQCTLKSGMRLNWAKGTFLKGQIEGFAKSESKIVMLKWVKQAIEAYNIANPLSPVVAPSAVQATSTATSGNKDGLAITPELTLSFLRKANLVCLVLIIFTLLQLLTTMHNIRATNADSILLQQQQQTLVQQLMDKMKCIKKDT